MKSFSKLPLYLGIFVFVLSVIVSASTIGQRKSLTGQAIQATTAKANLSLIFTVPDLVGVVLKSDKEIAGVDIVIKYDKEKVMILPSTLTAGNSFITSGGTLEDEEGTFLFSALTKDIPVVSGVVATFNVQAKRENDQVETELQFERGEGKTSLIEKSTGSDILGEAQGTRLVLPAK